MNSQIASHIWLAEPQLSFHPDRPGDRELHPLRGLLRFGPYSKGLVPDPIRVATIAPAGESTPLYSFMKELSATAKPRERRDYLPEWPGFRKVFNLTLHGAGKGCHLELDSSLDGEIKNTERPHVVLAERLVRTIQLLEGRRTDFDVLFIYLPERWSNAFEGQVGDDFDLHDHIKALTALRRLPVQVVREGSALSYHCRASVMWRIGIALYAKAGGVPWKLADSDEEIAHIGLSYAVRPVESDRPRFVTCCSQVFDADGAGLEFVAYDAHEIEVQRDNPFLSRTEMFKVMSRSMDLYRHRHAGRTPRRVMVHKTTEFKKEEIEGSLEALHLCETVDLIQIVADVSWRGALIEPGSDRQPDARSRPAAYPVRRGSLVGLGQMEALLWTHGDVSGIADHNKPYFQGGRSTPRPLRLVRHAGHGPWDDSAGAILGLTKMDWNNDNLYDGLPVTLGYAKVLARVVKRMTGLGNAPYQFRFFM